MSMERDFARIYAEHDWDDNVRSGPGSHPKLTRPYVALLQRFLREHHINSVTDLGCGDWSFSRLIDWSGVDYVGIDVVPDLIQTLTSTYATPGVRFVNADILNDDLPRADLAISKDVLQHWPNEAILHFIRRLKSFKYALLTN